LATVVRYFRRRFFIFIFKYKSISFFKITFDIVFILQNSIFILKN